MFYFRQELLVRENSAAYKVIASKLLFFFLGILYHLIEAVLATYFTVDDHIFILLLKFFYFTYCPLDILEIHIFMYLKTTLLFVQKTGRE